MPDLIAVTDAQVEAAKLIMKRDAVAGHPTPDAIQRIATVAPAAPPPDAVTDAPQARGAVTRGGALKTMRARARSLAAKRVG